MSERSADDSKTEQPTQRRLSKAREEGMVLRAHGVAAGAVLLAGAAILSIGGAKLIELLELSLRRGLSFEADKLEDPAHLFSAVCSVVTPALMVVVVLLVAMAIVGFLADVVVGGWSFSMQPAHPDFSRINPAVSAGAKIPH